MDPNAPGSCQVPGLGFVTQKPTARSPWVGFTASETWTQEGKVLETLGRSGQVPSWAPPVFGEKRSGRKGEKVVKCRPSQLALKG